MEVCEHPQSEQLSITKRGDKSLPGAFGMYALSLGVQRIDEHLPHIAYALLSGLNASTVGIIALAAVQVSELHLLSSLSRSSIRT